MATVRQIQVTFDSEVPERVCLSTSRGPRPAADGEESCIVMQDIEGNEFCLD